MSVQMTYDWATPKGIAGGIADLAPHAIDTLLNEEDSGKLKFGMGVCQGTKAGTQVKIPSASATKFEGVAVNNRTTEQDLDGNIRILKDAPVGVMRYGRVWVRVVDDTQAAYGKPVTCYTTPTEKAGLFGTGGTVKVQGRFLTGPENGLALVELFNPNTTIS